jgi:hypothetical protein
MRVEINDGVRWTLGANLPKKTQDYILLKYGYFIPDCEYREYDKGKYARRRLRNDIRDHINAVGELFKDLTQDDLTVVQIANEFDEPGTIGFKVTVRRASDGVIASGTGIYLYDEHYMAVAKLQEMDNAIQVVDLSTLPPPTPKIAAPKIDPSKIKL